MSKSKTIVLIAVASLTCMGGCRKKHHATNQEMLNEYGGEQYQEDIVADDYKNTGHQGDSIDPRTMASIQDAIETVWVADFEACLEIEMDRLENRWVGGDFAVEFTIESSGAISSVKFLSSDVKERKTRNGKGEYVPEGGKEARMAEGFGDCVTEKIYKWEFDPAPEVQYTHTYNGKLGEAW